MGWFQVEAEAFDEVVQKMEEYGAGSGHIIDDVLHGEGAKEIKDKIAVLLPASGRSWRGKAAPARSAMPASFSQDEDQLAVTIAARNRYSYLYFPDDGSNTRRHAGNQQFMLKGAEAASERVIELCLGKLVEAFES